MSWDLDFTIDGEPQSAKNRRRIVRIKDKPRLIKSKKALEYEVIFSRQCPVLEELMEGDLALWVDAFYASRRPDLACEELIKDLLQGKVYKNDRQIKVQGASWNLDRDRPRVRIRIRRIPFEGSTEMSSLDPYEIWGAVPPPK